MVISHLMAYLQQPRDAVLPLSFWTGRVSWNRSIAKSSAFVIWSQQHFRWSVYTINHELVWAVPFPVTGPIFSMWLGVIWIGHRALQIFGRQLRRHEWLTRFTWNKSRNAVYKYFNCVGPRRITKTTEPGVERNTLPYSSCTQIIINESYYKFAETPPFMVHDPFMISNLFIFLSSNTPYSVIHWNHRNISSETKRERIRD